MRNNGKKILSLVAALTLVGSTVAFAACTNGGYKGEKLEAGYVSDAEVVSNGGFSVEKGNYVYFINGVEDYTADNTYGDVLKGSLMRISKDQLKNKEYSKAQVVVPSLIGSQNFEAGIFIYGDYVYYASPTTDKTDKGEVASSQVDIKRAKIDGTAAPEEYFFRMSSNSANYRFVTVDGVDEDGKNGDDVFCLYEEALDSGTAALKSYNTATGKNTVLVAGAKSSFFYDMKNPENPNVYYTMAVTYNVSSDEAMAAGYDQLFCVNAAATATVNADKASYTVKNGATYDFDEKWMKEQNKNAKNDDADEPYDFKDYSTYPYVNLGTLVLDGVGKKSSESIFNVEDKATAVEPFGFTYTISRYENGGVYLTRTVVDSTITDTKLYYLSDARGENWNTVTANDFTANDKVDVVANDTTNASSTALFEVSEANGERVHTYIYLSSNTLCRAEVTKAGNGVAKVVNMARNLSGATLWKTEGDYLYYYGTGTNGNSLSRINYKGDDAEDVYNPLFANTEGYEEYQPITLALVDWNSSWFDPEMIKLSDDTSVLLYSNAQSYGDGATAYNYIYAAELGTTAAIQANIDAYEKVQEYLDEYSSSTASQDLIDFWFGTEGIEIPEESKALYDEEFFAEVEGKFTANEGALVKASSIIGLVGRMTDSDFEEIKDAWLESLLHEHEEEPKDKGMPGWGIALIVVGSVLVVLVAIGVPAVLYIKKKKEKQKEEEATVNAYKRKKIDTTDDKTINVYEDDEANEAPAEADENATESEAEESAAEAVEEETTNE